MLILGVTGCIGSGKSTVAKMLAARGARIIDADAIACDVVVPNSETFIQVVSEFGRVVLKEDGTLDRKRIAKIVFNDLRKLVILNNIIHPAIIGSIKKTLDKYQRTLPTEKVVVIDAPLIVETELLSLIDSLLVVVADEKIRLERLLKRGYSKDDAIARMKIQTPQDVLLKHADYVIENEGTLEKLKERVDELWEKIIGR
ncbi:dephospho-CoA kinase [Candidatus Oleimmundimicrobium sp.]|uniref:dephospho-CoA kinase n=1 Tax=Candidatus Oleimmundimicrobium sp. TaxID=3060597 RepID=UPI002724EF4B|nr:dephospho-CoA kinase [Candidatus Oleimmundimicrobium sp.]MDO8886394.1 dephospho-CoA kinase [Candidatus Oleimmundimicrobium sp.]